MNKSFAVACLLGLTAAQYEPAGLQQALWESSHPIEAVDDTEVVTDEVTDLEKVEQIVVGLLEGAFDAEDMNDVTQCIEDSEQILKLVQKTVTDFQKKKLNGAIDGVEDIVDILKEVYTAFKDCGTIGADLVAISEMISAMTSPQAFAFHVGKDLIVNGVSIYKEINQSMDDFKNEEWKSFGYNIGEACAQILIGKMSVVMNARRSGAMPEFLLEEQAPELDLDLEYALVMNEKKESSAMNGFTKGFFKDHIVGKFDKDEFDKCMDGFSAAWDNLRDGIYMIEYGIIHRDASTFGIGLMALLMVPYAIIEAFPDCKNIFDADVTENLNLITLNKIQNTLESESGNITLSDDGEVHMNGQVITNEIMDMIKAFKAGNFKDFGTDVMTILNLNKIEAEPSLFLF